MSFLRNAWYVAAWAEELGPDQLLSRTLLEEPVVFFREGDRLHALTDRCPHRFAPLSMGRLKDGVIECRYHGLRFDGGGACVFSPQHADARPPKVEIRSYPVVERHAIIWIWMGRPDAADETLIPNLTELDAGSGWSPISGYSHMKGDYRLAIDNLMDLSHPEFLHDSSLGSPAMATAEYEIRIESPQVIHSNRWFKEGPIPPLMERRFPTGGKPVEHWVNMRWQAPAHLWLDVGVTFPGHPRSEGLNTRAGHLLTPETSSTTHYFWTTLRRGEIAPDEREVARAALAGVFNGEDKPMIEAVQTRMGSCELWDMKPILLPGDKGAVQVRRALERLIAAEIA